MTGWLFLLFPVFFLLTRRHRTGDDCDLHEIFPRVFLGSHSAARMPHVLLALSVSHTLTVACGLDVVLPNHVKHEVIQLEDKPTEDILAVLPRAVDFIHVAVSNGGTVYVHCMAGVSRSASVVIAYAMAKECMSFREAFEHVKAIRPVVDPNPGFVAQLVAFEKMNRMCLPNYQEIVQCLSKNGEDGKLEI